MRNGDTSFWLHRLGASATRGPLPGDRETDVAIVGAGLTGLWTAYWVAQGCPGSKVTVLEARHVGFGASGRNAGWLSGKMVGLRQKLVGGEQGRPGVLALQRICIDAIDEILTLLRRHGHDVDAAAGGYLQVARTPAELDRIRRVVCSEHAWGLTHDDVRVIDRRDLDERLNVHEGMGALYSPHNACLNPAKLVTAVASIAEDAGVVIYENTAVERIGPGKVITSRGSVRADVIIRATEAFTARLPGHRRDLLPMRSSMIVTEPIPHSAWTEIGWDAREGLSGASHRYYYAQRTIDDRIALGGRGWPYRYGSRVDRNGELDPCTVRQLHETLLSLFPSLGDIRIEHAWCGVLGVPRDWTPSVNFDQHTRLGTAGGYVGQGLTASFVAARTLVDLVCGQESRYTRLPWTNRTSPDWEPEPVRFTGAYAVHGLYQMADIIENRFPMQRTSRLAHMADRISGR